MFDTPTDYDLRVPENSTVQIGDPVTASDRRARPSPTNCPAPTPKLSISMPWASCHWRLVPRWISRPELPMRSLSIATEAGPDGLTATRNVELTVTDVNEAPMFNPSTDYELTVEENATGNIGDPVRATDPERRLLSYKLSGTDKSAFDISHEGSLSLASRHHTGLRNQTQLLALGHRHRTRHGTDKFDGIPGRLADGHRCQRSLP